MAYRFQLQFRQNSPLVLNFPYCWIVFWGWSWCWHWTHRYEWYPHQQSHEFRNIPNEYEDWFGRTNSQPQLMYGFGIEIRLPSALIKVDQKSEGGLNDDDKWFQYFDFQNQPLRVRGFFGEPGYARNGFRRFNFSYEKSTTIVSGYWWCFGCWGHCWWWFGSFPQYIWWWSHWNWFWYTTNDSMLFPVSAKFMRIRLKANGQRLAGYEWWHYGHHYQLMIPFRHVNLRSTFKIDNSPTVLVDFSPYWRGATKPLMVMKIEDAASIKDGRDTWFLHDYPIFKRWEHDDARICASDILVTSQCGFPSLESIVEYRTENTLFMPAKDNCIQATNKLQEWKCNKNVNASSSSLAPINNNHPCNVLLEKPTKFQWMPNDEKLEVVFNMNQPYAFLKGFEIEWMTAPKEWGIQCYSDWTNKWIIQDIIYNGSKSHKINFRVKNFCTSLSLKILKIDEKKMKCREGICAGIEKLQIVSTLYETQYGKCNEDDKNFHNSKFYMEPANAWFNYWPRDVEFHISNIVTEYKAKSIKMKFRLASLKQILSQEKSMLPAGESADKKVKSETCIAGPCLKFVKGKNLPKLLKDLLQAKSRLGKMSSNSSIMGSSKVKPSPNCSFIKKQYDIKVNGFMWIRNQCSKKSYKTQCMNSLPTPRGFLIENNHEFQGANIVRHYKIDRPEHFIKICEKPGFELAKIASIEDLETLAFLALEYGFTQHQNGGLIIGYDFNCHKPAGCRGEYFSLDGSISMNTIASEFLNKINKSFKPVKGNEVLILTSGTIQTSSLSDTHVNSVPCETINEITGHPITCGVSFADLYSFGSMSVICPNTCSTMEQYPVYGSGVYSANSSVCRAMLHSGNYSKFEDVNFAIATLHKGLIRNFTSSQNNGINSLASDKEQMAFSISTLNITCPYDKVKSLKFIQNDEKSFNNDELNIIESIINKKSESKESDNKKVENDNDDDEDSSLNKIYKNLRMINDETKNNDYSIDQDELDQLNDFITNYKDMKSNKNKSYLINKLIKLNENNKNHYHHKDRYQNNNKIGGLKIKNLEKLLVKVNKSILDVISDKNSAKDTQQKEHKYADTLNSDPDIKTHKTHKHLLIHNLKSIIKKLMATPKSNKKILTNNKISSELLRESNQLKILKPTFNNIIKEQRFKLTDNILKEIGTDVTMDQALKVMNQMQKWINNDKELMTNKDSFNDVDKISKFNKYLLSIYNQSINNKGIMKKFKNTKLSNSYNINSDNNWYKNVRLKYNNNTKYYDKQRFNNEDDWKKIYPNHDRDLRPDETKSKEYYREKDQTKHRTRKFFMDGDGSTLRKILNMLTVSTNALIQFNKKQNEEWINTIKDIQELIGKNNKSMKDAEPEIVPTISEQLTLNAFGLIAARAANRELSMVETLLKLYEDKQLSMFKQVNMDQIVDIPSGNSMPLPDYWKITNPKTSSEEFTEVQVVKQDVSPHVSAIQIISNPVDDSGYGVIIETRQHRTYDGSLHFSFKIPNNQTIFGVMIRYYDQFSHQGLKFNVVSKLITFQLKSPFNYTDIQSDLYPDLLEGRYQRCVIKFTEFKIEYSLEVESSAAKEELDESFRREELTKPFKKLWNSGFKDGKIGFFCSNCFGLQIASVQLWSDTCIIKSSNSIKYIIKPQGSCKYKEDYKQQFNIKFGFYVQKGSKNIGEFKYGEIVNKLNSIINTTPFYNPNQIKGPAAFIFYKDDSLICKNDCKLEVSVVIVSGEYGNAIIGFKYSGPNSQYGLNINIGKKEDFIKIIKYDSTLIDIHIMKLEKKLKQNTWQKFVIEIKNNNIKVILDDSVIIENATDSNLMNSEGKYMFGLNNLLVGYSDIKFGSILPDPITEVINNKFEKEIDENDNLFSNEDSEGYNNNNIEKVEDTKSLAQEYECTSNNSIDARTMWCKKNFPGENDINECLNKFCDICCNGLKEECKLKCNSNIHKSIVDVSVFFYKCFSIKGENNMVKNNECKACCKNLMTPYISEDNYNKCLSDCEFRFDKTEGLFNTGSLSFFTTDN